MGRYHSNNTPKNPKEATVRDVIMGRGKRVSEWPGNIFFRQVVNQQRQAYADAHRSEKVQVAIDVIKKIESNKGRFMTEQPNGSWAEIDYARAVEKCCQALREKEKPNPPTGDPFSPQALKKSPSSSPETTLSSSRHGSKKRKTAPPASSRAEKRAAAGSSRRSASSSSRRGGQRKGKAESSEEEDSSSDGSSSSSDSDDSSSSSSSEESESESESESEVEVASDKGKKSDIAESPVNTARDCNGDEMIAKLHAFRKEYGHCAVPPEWSKDPLLADWCTIQRQTYRIVQAGYNTTETKATTNEYKALVERLKKVDFVWDYDEWHWSHKFNELVTSQNEAAKNQSEEVDPIAVYWLEDQRRQYVESKANVRPERTSKLQEAGIALT